MSVAVVAAVAVAVVVAVAVAAVANGAANIVKCIWVHAGQMSEAVILYLVMQSVLLLALFLLLADVFILN